MLRGLQALTAASFRQPRALGAMAPTVKVEETAIVAEYYYEVDSVEGAPPPPALFNKALPRLAPASAAFSPRAFAWPERSPRLQ